MEKKKALGYVRVSTRKQKDQNTQEMQIKTIEKYIQYKDLELIKIFQDLGKSGRKAEGRKQLEAMFQYIEHHPGEISCIVIAKLDRIMRSFRQLKDIIDRCIKNNVYLIAINNNLDLTDQTPYNKFFVGNLSLVSELEADMIFERTSEAREEAEAQGIICHRPKKELPMKNKDIIFDFKKGVSIYALARKNNVNWVTMNNRIKELGLK